MTVHGVQIRFNCANGEQYEKIGEFWDKMREVFPKAALLGVGYGWENDTLLYLIGKQRALRQDKVERVLECFPNAEYTKVRMPERGWDSYTVTADKLDKLYEEIYKDGPLKYEIERFYPNGNAYVSVYREG